MDVKVDRDYSQATTSGNYYSINNMVNVLVTHTVDALAELKDALAATAQQDEEEWNIDDKLDTRPDPTQDNRES